MDIDMEEVPCGAACAAFGRQRQRLCLPGFDTLVDACQAGDMRDATMVRRTASGDGSLGSPAQPPRQYTGQYCKALPNYWGAGLL